MNGKNLVVITVMISANLISFFFGGYHTLSPILFLAGFAGASILSAWIATGMRTRDLVSLVVMTTLLAAIDEYAHTSAGTLTYFDHAIPSPLTVFGWGLFIILILTVARLLVRIKSLEMENSKIARIVPVLVFIVLVSATAVLAGYVSVLNVVLVLVYWMLGVSSFYYTYRHSLKWNLSLMISSLAFGFFMEFTGAYEGLWTFHFMEPISLLILFSWPLRIWTISAFCLIFKVDFSEAPLTPRNLIYTASNAHGRKS